MTEKQIEKTEEESVKKTTKVMTRRNYPVFGSFPHDKWLDIRNLHPIIPPGSGGLKGTRPNTPA